MEKPNLDYINELSRGDEAIKAELISIIKSEFPEEIRDYHKSIENIAFKNIEENVHKLKHKISILGLVKSYEIANEFEHNLRELNLNKKEDFDEILKVISDYVESL